MQPSALIGPGRLVLIVGPSGAGKDTLIHLVQRHCARNADVIFPVRSVTREASQHENNRSVAPERFAHEAASGSFALWWDAHGHRYGIPRSIDDDLGAGRSVIVNVSRTAVAEARRRYANVLVIAVTAPADVLAARLAQRNRPSDGSLMSRLDRAASGAEVAVDATVSNVGDVDTKAAELLALIFA